VERNVRVAAVQFHHQPGDKERNLVGIRAMVETAAQQGVELIVFPECCVTGYWHLRRLSRDALCQLAEPIPDGPTTQLLRDWARQLGISIGAGLLERDGERLYNSYVVALCDGSCYCHRKLHAFVSPYLSSGDRFTVFDTPHGFRAAILICYDNNIIENVRCCALLGAEVLLAPHQTGGCNSGSPYAMGRIDPQLWHQRQERRAELEAEFRGEKGRGWLMRWLPARAHDNGLFLIFSNGVGLDDDEVRTGNAMILDCYGRILAESSAVEDDLVIADLPHALRPRCTGVRWMRARRPSLYTPIVQPTGQEQDTRRVRFDHLIDPNTGNIPSVD